MPSIVGYNQTKIRRLRNDAAQLGYRIKLRRNAEYYPYFLLLNRHGSEVGGPYNEGELIAAVETLKDHEMLDGGREW